MLNRSSVCLKLTLASFMLCCSWAYARYAFGAQSREHADQLWKNRQFGPIANEAGQSAEALLRCALSFRVIKRYAPSPSSGADVLKKAVIEWISPEQKQQLDEHPKAPYTKEEMVDITILGLPLPVKATEQAPKTRAVMKAKAKAKAAAAAADEEDD
jgi:hypothetical protein